MSVNTFTLQQQLCLRLDRLTVRPASNSTSTFQQLLKSVFSKFRSGKTLSDANDVRSISLRVPLWSDRPEWQRQLARSVDMYDLQRDAMDVEDFFLHFVHPYATKTLDFITFCTKQETARQFVRNSLAPPDNGIIANLNRASVTLPSPIQNALTSTQSNQNDAVVNAWIQTVSPLSILLLAHVYFNPSFQEPNASSDELNAAKTPWTNEERSFTHAWICFATQGSNGEFLDRKELLQLVRKLIDLHWAAFDPNEVHRMRDSIHVALERCYALLEHSPNSLRGTFEEDPKGRSRRLTAVDDVDAQGSAWTSVAHRAFY